MLQRGLITILLLSGVLYSMGEPPPNYDAQYDEMIEREVSADIESIKADRLAKEADILSTIKLKSLVFQEKFITGSDGKKVKKNMPVKSVARGDSVVYINTVTNMDREVKANIVIKNPIPDGAEYLKGSAICDKGCTISYSKDGEETLSHSDENGASYIEFHFSNIYPKKEVRMGFRAIIK